MRSEPFIDRRGYVQAELTWVGEHVLEVAVPGAALVGIPVPDPLWGEGHEIIRVPPGPPTVAKHPEENVLTSMSALDWRKPREIPAIRDPGKLPPGVGGALMNLIAMLAKREWVKELRYAGPYPTSALWSTLMRSFRTESTEEEFTAQFAERAARVARDPMPMVFVPAPHERIAIVEGDIGEEREPRGIVEVRDGQIERATIDGAVFSRGTGVGRLVDRPDAVRSEITFGGERRVQTTAGVRAEVWFADELYAHVATFHPNGDLVSGPHAIPPYESDVIGKAFPPDMVGALAELIADLVPAPLGPAATRVLASRTLRWADLGARAASRAGDELHLHAALWRLAPYGMGRVAMALVEALVPIVAPLAAASVAASV